MLKVFKIANKFRTRKKFLVMLAFAGLSMGSAIAQNTYIITSCEPYYDVTVNGHYLIQQATIQEAVEKIRYEVYGDDCIIQFGETGATEPVYAKEMVFDDNGGQWGLITITGNVGMWSQEKSLFILKDNVSMESKADVSLIGINNILFELESGTLTISGGTITSNEEAAIYNRSKVIINAGTIHGCVYNLFSGEININGGTISTPSMYSIDNDMNGTVNINGGTISSAGTYVILNQGNGTLNVKGGTVSSNAVQKHAIYNKDIESTVNITGGTVEANGNGGYALYNLRGTVNISDNAKILGNGNSCTAVYSEKGTANISGGKILTTSGWGVYNIESTVNITGGMVAVTTGKAIYNEEGATNISGGIIFAYGDKNADVIEGDYTQTGNAVIVAWNNDAGTTAYPSGTTTDIFKNPTTATAIWAKWEGNSGIAVENSNNKGFITIEDVTITDMGVDELSENGELRIYPNPTRGELRIINNEQLIMNNVEIYDIMGRMVFTSPNPSEGGELAPSPLERAGVRLNVSHLPTGIYFLRMGNKTVKFVKQ